MKKSFYNFLFQQNEGKSILYNSRTGAMAGLDEEHVRQFREYSESELEVKNPQFAEALLQNGFAVEDGVSELDMIRYDSLKARFASQSLGLTIVPTQDCNFGCVYCFEKENMNSARMNEETQNALVEYVKKNVPAEGKLQVCWYGGEPLLALDIIEKLTYQFLQICADKRATYEANIVTNGYSMTENIVQRLLACKIYLAQVTLDGEPEVHNARRPLKDGRETYATIWENLLALKQFRTQLKVHVRVNVDINNRGALDKIKVQMVQEGMDDYVFVYPGKVVSEGNCYHQDVCYSDREFALLEQDFYIEDGEHLPIKYPGPRHNVCCADNNNAVVIDADGFIYKCWMDVGNSKYAVANVKDNDFQNEQLLYQYVLHEAMEEEECRNCKFLPICLGGCPRMRVNGERDCTAFKHTLRRYMDYLPESMRKIKGES